jgi:hypothetical protein
MKYVCCAYGPWGGQRAELTTIRGPGGGVKGKLAALVTSGDP